MGAWNILPLISGPGIPSPSLCNAASRFSAGLAHPLTELIRVLRAKDRPKQRVDKAWGFLQLATVFEKNRLVRLVLYDDGNWK